MRTLPLPPMPLRGRQLNSLGTNGLVVFGKMALKVDEQWVRERVHLKHDNLGKLKKVMEKLVECLCIDKITVRFC